MYHIIKKRLQSQDKKSKYLKTILAFKVIITLVRIYLHGIFRLLKVSNQPTILEWLTKDTTIQSFAPLYLLISPDFHVV